MQHNSALKEKTFILTGRISELVHNPFNLRLIGVHMCLIKRTHPGFEVRADNPFCTALRTFGDH